MHISALNCALAMQKQRDEAVNALRTFVAFYDDLAASNPGFMGKLCLQNYGQWHQALEKVEMFERKYPELWKQAASV